MRGTVTLLEPFLLLDSITPKYQTVSHLLITSARNGKFYETERSKNIWKISRNGTQLKNIGTFIWLWHKREMEQCYQCISQTGAEFWSI